MPYISRADRDDLDARGLGTMTDEVFAGGWTVGALNYIIVRILLAWLGRAPTYTTYNSAIGVLECVKQELYRRKIAAYEDEKCNQNGDVFE